MDSPASSSVAVHVGINSADGARIHASVFPTERPVAGLLIVHGLQSHAGWVEATGTGSHLAEQGILTIAFDRRGSGRSEGERGHATSSDNFLEDLAAARELLRHELSELRAPDAPIHVLANCFGTRVVLPFLIENPHSFASVILTSPATHMSPEGDYGLRDKISILSAAPKRRFDTPLSDNDFVRSGPWLDWIRHDAGSLRSCTASFLRATERLTLKMGRAVKKLDVPLLVLIAEDDVLVRNDAIERTFRSKYGGPLEMHQLPGDHYMDFTKAQEEFRARVTGWVLDGWLTATIQS